LIITAIGLLIAAVVTAYATCEPFRNAVNALGATLMNILKPAIDVVTGALSWLWHNIVEPFIGALNVLGNSVAGVANWLGGLFSQVGSTTNQIDNASRSMEHLYGVIGKPPSTGLIESFECLNKVMRDVEATGIAVGVGGGGGAVGPGSIVSSPSPPVNINFNAPLVNVEGSADEDVAMRAANFALSRLKTTVVEATSAAAPVTQKRIRVEQALVPLGQQAATLPSSALMGTVAGTTVKWRLF